MAKAVAENGKIKVELLRSIWDHEGVRHDPPEVIEMDVDMAMDAIETGAVTRAK
jgi:hypothetical protein